jgi:plastocyanin
MRRRRIFAFAAVAVLAATVFSGLALAAGDGASDNVRLREFRFVGVNNNYAPGSTTFHFQNAGQFPHNFTIVYTAQGRKFKSRTLAAGESQDLTVNLRPGSYLAVCTVFTGYHLAQGMTKRFTVGEINLETGRWG